MIQTGVLFWVTRYIKVFSRVYIGSVLLRCQNLSLWNKYSEWKNSWTVEQKVIVQWFKWEYFLGHPVHQSQQVDTLDLFIALILYQKYFLKQMKKLFKVEIFLSFVFILPWDGSGYLKQEKVIVNFGVLCFLWIQIVDWKIQSKSIQQRLT